MSSIPQMTPLWLAEPRGSDIYAGRVVGWHLAPPLDGPPGLPGLPDATPIVAFTTPDGLLLESGAPRGALAFLAETRDEAVAAALEVAGGQPTGVQGVAAAPVAPDEEDDDPDGPDPRTRVHRLRRLTVADLTDAIDPDGGTVAGTDPATRRIARTER